MSPNENVKARGVKPHAKAAVQSHAKVRSKSISEHPKGHDFTFKVVRSDAIVKGGIMAKENSIKGDGIVSPERMQRKKRHRPKSFENFAPFVTMTRPR